MNKLAFLGIGTTGVVALGGGGLYMYYGNDETPPTKEKTKVLMNQRLTSEGFKPLRLDANNQQLKAVLEKYKKATKNTFGGDPKIAAEQTLITECQKIFDKESNNETNYKLANQWCVKESTISDIFEGSKWKKLSTDGIEDAEGHWAKKVAKHKESKAQNKIPATLGNADSNHIKEMKDACKALDITKINTTEVDFNTKFEQVKEWCAIKE